jgi:restriction endonuclease S subunit
MEKMERNRKRLESLEKHVKKLRKEYDFRRKNADKIIQSRVGHLTGETNFDWEER